jgi:hypothetical protein
MHRSRRSADIRVALRSPHASPPCVPVDVDFCAMSRGPKRTFQRAIPEDTPNIGLIVPALPSWRLDMVFGVAWELSLHMEDDEHMLVRLRAFEIDGVRLGAKASRYHGG